MGDVIMGKLKNTQIIRKYHYLIRPICDLDNKRAREYKKKTYWGYFS